MKIKYKNLILALIGLINVVLHLLPALHFEYHRDELLYYALSNHLDVGYATSPPLMGFMAFISKNIFGYSVFAVRLFPALVSGCLVYLTALMAKELNGNFRSQLISAIGVYGSMFLVLVYCVFTPYCFDIFFWTLAIYLLIRFIKTETDKYLLLLGIVTGIAFLNKYSIVLLVISVLIVLPFTKLRKLFSNKYLYLALLLSLIIASPNLIWQATHHFPVVNHMKELNDSQLVNVNRLEFIVEQLIFLLPFTIFILPGIIYFCINKRFKDFRFIISVSVVVIVLLLVLRGKSFYASGLYPFLIVVGALFVEKFIVNRWLFSILFMTLILFSAILLPLNLPVFEPPKLVAYFDRFAKITGIDLLRKDEDGNYRKLPQLDADMLGWNEIAEKTNSAWSQVKDKDRGFIFCSNYGQAGAISLIGDKFGLPEPISFSDTYRFWFPAVFKNDINELVYVVGSDAMDSRNFRDTKDFFTEMIEVGNVNNNLAIEYNTKIYLFRKPKGDFNAFWRGQTDRYVKSRQ
jgi:hypothetical protein